MLKLFFNSSWIYQINKHCQMIWLITADTIPGINIHIFGRFMHELTKNHVVSSVESIFIWNTILAIQRLSTTKQNIFKYYLLKSLYKQRNGRKMTLSNYIHDSYYLLLLFFLAFRPVNREINNAINGGSLEKKFYSFLW